MSRAPDANHLVLWTSQWKSAIEPGTCKNTMTLTILSWDGTKEVMGSGWVQEFGGPESILRSTLPSGVSLGHSLREVQKGMATLANLIHPHYAFGVDRLKSPTNSGEGLFKRFQTSHSRKANSGEHARPLRWRSGCVSALQAPTNTLEYSRCKLNQCNSCRFCVRYLGYLKTPMGRALSLGCWFAKFKTDRSKCVPMPSSNQNLPPDLSVACVRACANRTHNILRIKRVHEQQKESWILKVQLVCAHV